jgi:hypothetical protein
VKTFGYRRVNEALLEVVESGSDFQKAGAVNASYWAQVGLSFLGNVPAYTPEYAIPESRAAYEALADIRDRRRRLFLETFVNNPNLDVRRSLIPKLDLAPAHYPESHRALVAQAIAIARGHTDAYIRHRVEIQLGSLGPLAPLPHRERKTSNPSVNEED